MTTQPLTELATVSDLERTSAIGAKGEGKQANNLLLWGVIMMFTGVTIGILGKKLMHEDIVTVVGVLISLAGMFLAVYPYLSPSPRQKSDSRSPSQPEVLTPSRPTEYLSQGSNIEYIPSITERTTGLLKNSAATRLRQKDGEAEPNNSERREKP